MTDIEPAIRKALRPRIGNVERRTRYLLDAHAVAVAVVVARERRQHDDAQRVMADDINRIAAERDEARETAANLATVWDRERETMAAHVGALEGERDKAEKLAEALRLARRNDIRALTAERDDLAAELARLRGYQTVAEQRIEELCREFPACPECGCRTPDEPDQYQCGCDAGCNDGENAPGVQVLMDERDRLREQLAAREAGRPPFHADPSSGLVCSACGTEACANGVLMCDEAKTASFAHRQPAAQTPVAGARSAPREET